MFFHALVYMCFLCDNPIKLIFLLQNFRLVDSRSLTEIMMIACSELKLSWKCGSLTSILNYQLSTALDCLFTIKDWSWPLPILHWQFFLHAIPSPFYPELQLVTWVLLYRLRLTVWPELWSIITSGVIKHP